MRSCYPEIAVNKREYFETRLRAGSGFLHLDARRPGVIIRIWSCNTATT
jgi:hypothetical protein